MPIITLPDGNNLTFPDKVTGLDVAEKIIRAITMDETSLELLGREGRKNIIKKFNVEKMCFSTYSEYKDC